MYLYTLIKVIEFNDYFLTFLSDIYKVQIFRSQLLNYYKNKKIEYHGLKTSRK